MRREPRAGSHRRTWVGILLGGLVLLIGLVGFMVAGPGATPSPTDSGGYEATPLAVVRYDGTAFTPQSLRVPAGTRVTFVNESGLERPLYIASDPHPTHENYPGLDARTTGGGTPPQPGANQSFTFTRRGIWGYHDHNSPAATGTVEVF